MGIRQDLATLKTLASQGGELLLLRLRVLQMDANEQLRGVLVIAALIVLAAVVLVVMLVALLLGLNVVLTAQAKIWLFFSVAAAGVPRRSAASLRSSRCSLRSLWGLWGRSNVPALSH